MAKYVKRCDNTNKSRACRISDMELQDIMKEMRRMMRTELDVFHKKLNRKEECIQRSQSPQIDLFEKRTKRRSSTLSSYGSVEVTSAATNQEDQREYKTVRQPKLRAPHPVVTKVTKEEEESDSFGRNLEQPIVNKAKEEEEVSDFSAKHLEQSVQKVVCQDQKQMHPHGDQLTNHSNFFAKACEEFEEVFPPKRGIKRQPDFLIGTEVVLVHEKKVLANCEGSETGTDLILPCFINMFDIKHDPTGIGTEAVLIHEEKQVDYLSKKIAETQGGDLMVHDQARRNKGERAQIFFMRVVKDFKAKRKKVFEVGEQGRINDNTYEMDLHDNPDLRTNPFSSGRV